MLVSCVMPTCNRRSFIPAAIDSFLKQTYSDKELIIVDDGTDKVKDLIPDNPAIRYIEPHVKLSTGCKRNVCNCEAHGDIIAHFDDDDWSAPDRLEDQVNLLMKSGKSITGYANALFWDIRKQRAFYYQSPISGYVTGLSLCYLRDHWRRHPFTVMQMGSDNVFILESLQHIAVSTCYKNMVARIHNCNVSPKDGIRTEAPRSLIPSEFWGNDALRSETHDT